MRLLNAYWFTLPPEAGAPRDLRQKGNSNSDERSTAPLYVQTRANGWFTLDMGCSFPLTLAQQEDSTLTSRYRGQPPEGPAWAAFHLGERNGEGRWEREGDDIEFVRQFINRSYVEPRGEKPQRRSRPYRGPPPRG